MTFDDRASTADTDDEVNELSEGDSYERERLENIKQRDALLSTLGLDTQLKPPQKNLSNPKLVKISAEEARQRKKSKAKEAAARRIQPLRKSRRVAEKDKMEIPKVISLHEHSYDKPTFDLIPKAVAPILAPGPAYSFDDYEEHAPRPTRRQDSRLQFEGRWAGVFTPNLTPEEMFRSGAFGGCFFRNTYSRVAKTELLATKDVEELPFTLDASATPRLLTSSEPDASVNRFLVTAGQSLEEWEKAGWIWQGDPRGWAQWYVRFWGGRRCKDDERQVKRWLKVAGPTGRFKRALLKKIHQSGGKAAVGDEDVGRVLRQCLWQWGYELNENEFQNAMAG
nr:hypothetical protein L203_04763 [Cryptococcus depauperatus CBS 7841]